MAERVTQEALESLEQPDSAKVRATQDAAEVLEQPNTQKVRATADALEVLERPNTTKVRVTAEAIEVLRKVAPDGSGTIGIVFGMSGDLTRVASGARSWGTIVG